MKNQGVEVNLEADVNDAVYALKSIDRDSRRITKGILGGIGTYTARAVKKDYLNNIGLRTGNLLKRIRKRITKKGDTVYVASWARSKNHALYGFVLANGADVTPRPSNPHKVMTFQIDGKWIRKNIVHQKAHDFIVGPGQRYLSSPKYRSDLEKLKQRQIKKVFKKKGIKVE